MNRQDYAKDSKRNTFAFCGFCGKAECKETHEQRPVADDRFRYANPFVDVNVEGRRTGSVTISG